MNTRLCTINLEVKDYTTRDKGTFLYHGEVVVIDEDLKQYAFRFYNTDSGTLAVSIDASKEVIKVFEQNDDINVVIGLQENNFHQCLYKIGENRLELVTKTWEAKILDNQIVFEYDLYDKNDVEHLHPMTMNRVTIDFEGESKAC